MENVIFLEGWSLKVKLSIQQEDTRKGANSEVNVVYEKDDSILILSNFSTTSYSWVLHPRASFHATSCMKFLTNYQEGKFGKVSLGDNKSCEIVGKGDIILQLEGGGKWFLKYVHHVPKLEKK